jgi:hypothetical protein
MLLELVITKISELVSSILRSPAFRFEAVIAWRVAMPLPEMTISVLPAAEGFATAFPVALIAQTISLLFFSTAILGLAIVQCLCLVRRCGPKSDCSCNQIFRSRYRRPFDLDLWPFCKNSTKIGLDYLQPFALHLPYIQ